MFGALCRASGTEPKSTYLHSYLHGNPAAPSLPFFILSLLLSLPRSALRLKSNSRPHINSDQSDALICRAGGDSGRMRQARLHGDGKGQASCVRRPGVLRPTRSLPNPIMGCDIKHAVPSILGLDARIPRARAMLF